MNWLNGIIIKILIFHNIFEITFSQCVVESQKCDSSITQEYCSSLNQFLELIQSENCCPICRGGLGLQDPCPPEDPNEETCAPGLYCENNLCELDRSTCAYTYHLTHLLQLPTCNADGTYAAKQCKGDRVTGRCFCYNEIGNRIFGWDWWNNGNNMTCACSRLRNQLEQNGRLDVTLHCQQNGNFEELQCDSGVCWCAEPETGNLQKNTRAVPETMWMTLPCYQSSEMGTAYLRQCESASHAQKLLKKSFITRGTLDMALNDIQCDYDGSYGTYTIENGIAACIWRDGTRLSPYQAESNQVSQMNCNCARDQRHFEAENLRLTLTCSGNGNYAPIQDQNGQIFCVDSDGFAVTEFLNSTVGLNCDDFMYQNA